MEKIDAIILAGGLGTRLRNVVNDLPKVLAPVNGKPFLDIVLCHLHKSGRIGTAVLAVGYMADKVTECYRDSGRFNFNIVFSVESTPLGTAAPSRRPWVYGNGNDPCHERRLLRGCESGSDDDGT